MCLSSFLLHVFISHTYVCVCIPHATVSSLSSFDYFFPLSPHIPLFQLHYCVPLFLMTVSPFQPQNSLIEPSFLPLSVCSRMFSSSLLPSILEKSSLLLLLLLLLMKWRKTIYTSFWEVRLNAVVVHWESKWDKQLSASVNVVWASQQMPECTVWFPGSYSTFLYNQVWRTWDFSWTHVSLIWIKQCYTTSVPSRDLPWELPHFSSFFWFWSIFCCFRNGV